MGANSSLANWFAGKLNSDSESGFGQQGDVTGAVIDADGGITISRAGLSDVRVAVGESDPIDRDSIDSISSSVSDVRFLLHAGQPTVTGSAIQAGRAKSIAIGTLGDLYRACRLADPGRYVPREVEFVERGLKQHSAVSDVRILNRDFYEIDRPGLTTIRVAFVYEYEITAENLRAAAEQHPTANGVVTSHASARDPSSVVRGVAAELGVQVMVWRTFYGRLNRSWT